MWKVKAVDLGKLCGRYSDTLELYKLMMVQMKQLVKDKDMLLGRMRNLNKSSAAFAEKQVGHIRKDAAQGTATLLTQSRAMSTLLNGRI